MVLKPIDQKIARDFIKKHHYSGKVVNNSRVHIGVFWYGKLSGVMQYGASLDKRKIQGLVNGTGWNEFIELNRMAFNDDLPKNSESRAIAISLKLLKKHAPHIKWVISFADAAQCGDGCIYRASNFVLTGIKKNNQIWVSECGEAFSRTSLTDNHSPIFFNRAMKTIINRTTVTKGKSILTTGGASMEFYKQNGFKPLEGFQLRYIYFIDKSYREKLTVPEIPFSRIDEIGANMYKGKKL